jgi:preprotein translocase subunit YajC
VWFDNDGQIAPNTLEFKDLRLMWNLCGFADAGFSAWRAVCAAAETTAASPSGNGSGGLPEMLPIFVGMAILFYFIVLRPQSRERKERQRMLDAVKKGDRVVTNGGIYGKVMDVDKDTVTLEVAPKIQMKFGRWAIHTVDVKKVEETDKSEKSE